MTGNGSVEFDTMILLFFSAIVFVCVREALRGEFLLIEHICSGLKLWSPCQSSLADWRRG